MTKRLLDVRPAGLVKGEDAVRFAASVEAGLESGWRASAAAGDARRKSPAHSGFCVGRLRLLPGGRAIDCPP